MVLERSGDSSISCRRNWGGSLKKIMKTVPATASSSKQMGKRKLKGVVEDVVVEDVVDEEEDDDFEEDGSEASSDDDDYEQEVKEDDPDDELDASDYVEEVYVESRSGHKKRKVVEKVDEEEEPVPNTTTSKPVKQQKRIIRTVKRPPPAKRQYVERPVAVERQYVERPAAMERQYVERPPAVERQYLERPPAVERQYVERPAAIERQYMERLAAERQIVGKQYVERSVPIQRRRLVVEQDDQIEIDLEPGPSVGEKVKMSGVVVSTQLRMCKKSANYNCRVSAFSDLITVLEIEQGKIDLLNRCGFGGLLKLKLKKIDRRFCYWLMSRVDHERSTFVGVDGKELPLGPEQWRCIFYLARGPKPVPEAVEDPVMESKVTNIAKNFGDVNGSGREYISIQMAYDCIGLMPIGTEEEKDHFMRAFLIVMLGCILCPTTNGQSLATSLLPAVTVGVDASQYDWCSMVHSRLMGHVRDFHKRFDAKGFVAGGGGCGLFLMIFYLDHLALPPLSWGRLPRIDVWTKKKISAAIQQDLLPSLDYGKLKLVDVAYGERHPWEPRDTFESLEVRVGNEVVKILKPYLERFESILNATNRGFVRNAPKERSPIVRSPIERSPVLNVTSSKSESIEDMSAQVNKGRLEETYRQLQEVVGMGVQDPVGHVVGEVSSAVKDQFGQGDHVDQSQISEPAPSIVAPTEGQDDRTGDKGFTDESAGGLNMVGGVTDEGNKGSAGEEENNRERDRSVGKRPLKPSAKVYYDEYICGNRKVSTLGSADTALINYCRSWSSKGGSGPIMLQCDGEFACRDSCHDVLHCRRKIGTQYVNVVSKIYTKEWAIKYEGHSKRIMMHPAYGVKLITNMDTPTDLAKKHVQPLRGVAASQLAVVFVPVVKEDHWWCAAFSFKEEKAWIIDSIFADPVAEHKDYLSKLVNAVDVLVKYHDHTWPEGSIVAWPIESLGLVQQPDIVCCGAVMLACIKDSTDRFRTKWQMDEGDVKAGRVKLLIEDLISVCNERRQDLDSLITEEHEG